jgi:hypothetical protein
MSASQSSSLLGCSSSLNISEVRRTDLFRRFRQPSRKNADPMGRSEMEYVALILFCGFLADSLLTKQKPGFLRVG